jgi:hypothetical protein
MVARHLPEDFRRDFPLAFTNGTFEQRVQRLVVGMDVRRQPKRRAEVIVGTVGASLLKCPAAESLGELRKIRQVLLRIGI